MFPAFTVMGAKILTTGTCDKLGLKLLQVTNNLLFVLCISPAIKLHGQFSMAQRAVKAVLQKISSHFPTSYTFCPTTNPSTKDVNTTNSTVSSPSLGQQFSEKTTKGRGPFSKLFLPCKTCRGYWQSISSPSNTGKCSMLAEQPLNRGN